MIHYKIIIILTLNLFLISVGCRGQTVESGRPIASTVPLANYINESTTTPALSNLPIMLSVAAPVTTPLTVTSGTTSTWSTFTYNIGSPKVSIDYPTGWNVEVLDLNSDSLILAQFFPSDNLRERGFSLTIHSFDNGVDPRNPPESGELWCSIPWKRSLAIPDVDGIIYLSCPVGGDSSYTHLSAYYNSEKYKLKIYIAPGLYIDRTILQSSSITDTISQEYGLYEHVMESLRLTEPGQN